MLSFYFSLIVDFYKKTKKQLNILQFINYNKLIKYFDF